MCCAQARCRAGRPKSWPALAKSVLVALVVPKQLYTLSAYWTFGEPIRNSMSLP